MNDVRERVGDQLPVQNVCPFLVPIVTERHARGAERVDIAGGGLRDISLYKLVHDRAAEVSRYLLAAVLEV
eukprot:9427359-Pyramimonas_sp.AAC.1